MFVSVKCMMTVQITELKSTLDTSELIFIYGGEWELQILRSSDDKTLVGGNQDRRQKLLRVLSISIVLYLE